MQKLTRKQIFLLSSLIFGMFFGAGNLIFPAHLGQLAGKNWLPASLGFLISSTLLPLAALVALSKTRSTGLFDFAKPVSKGYGMAFLIMSHLALGPLFATPRTAALGYQLSIGEVIPPKYNTVGLLVFSFLFFIIVYYLSTSESNLTQIIGKYLNPIFLLVIALLFLTAFLFPIGNLHHSPSSETYMNLSLSNGFLEGYNTMDALAALAFGVTIIRAIQNFGIKKKESIALYTIKSGALSMLLCASIYVGIILLGTLSLNKFSLSDNGGIVLTEMTNYYFGRFGLGFMTFLSLLAVLTSAMGLAASFAQDFSSQFHFLSYKGWLRLTILFSFITANFGLNTILNWAIPVLMFLYPLAMALIIPALFSNYFENDRLIYRYTTIFTLLPALFGLIQNLPIQTPFIERIISFYTQTIPFAKEGLGWIIPNLFGLVLGVAIHKFSRNKINNRKILQQ
ncbi:branched-chain amino acid transport system II carrier protein [Lactococcus garvieae]|uniref:branched-chain amino acid transport system II carrier protein n=1 Tax=Lactococcus garvieae TaxID=1363 RepID=UPI0009BEAF1C|nr:branched-chain amino acid transport system II carrier protein [Lactococcus garvieae]